jgi:cobalt transporter subunit CbtB
MEHLTTAPRSLTRAPAATSVAAALAAILLGAFLVLGTGFAPISVAHNAAHDARHSFAFPCH